MLNLGVVPALRYFPPSKSFGAAAHCQTGALSHGPIRLENYPLYIAIRLHTGGRGANSHGKSRPPIL